MTLNTMKVLLIIDKSLPIHEIPHCYRLNTDIYIAETILAYYITIRENINIAKAES